MITWPEQVSVTAWRCNKELRSWWSDEQSCRWWWSRSSHKQMHPDLWQTGTDFSTVHKPIIASAESRGSRGKHECIERNILYTFAHNLLNSAWKCMPKNILFFLLWCTVCVICICIVYLSFCVLYPFHVFLCGAERGLYCSLYIKFWSHDPRESGTGILFVFIFNLDYFICANRVKICSGSAGLLPQNKHHLHPETVPIT